MNEIFFSIIFICTTLEINLNLFWIILSDKKCGINFFLTKVMMKIYTTFLTIIKVKKYCENKKYCNDNFNNLYGNHCYNFFPKLA